MATTKTPNMATITNTQSGVTNSIILAKPPSNTAGNLIVLTLSNGASETISQATAQELVAQLQNFASTGRLQL